MHGRAPIPEASSPASPRASTQGSTGKPKKAPTVTPRTFTRFFTPRSSLSRGSKVGASRQALRDITASASNRNAPSRRRTPTKDRITIFNDEDGEISERATKRRKRDHASITPRSSPLKDIKKQSLQVEVDPAESTTEHEYESDEEKPMTFQGIGAKPKGIIRFKASGAMGRELGTNVRLRGLDRCSMRRHTAGKCANLG